ncbi:MAG: translocation/assembly module TamB domain-containing protein [Myxococcales bacterium]|nr:translocation/assembly module TamB domain-containing protein [Myxococcales bacterium]
MAKDEKTSAKTKPRSLGRRVLRGVGIALLVPLVLVVVALGYLHSGPGQRKIRDILQTRVSERLNGSLTVGDLHFALFGDLTLSGLRIADEADHEVVTLDRLHISPNWGALLDGQVALREVSLDGLAVKLAEDEDGRLDVKSLVKPRPPEPPPKKKRDTHVVVEKLHLGGIDLTVDKADGSRIHLSDFGMDGRIDAVPSKRTAKVDLSLAAGFSLEKPAQGLSVAVTGIATGLAIDLVDGAGTLALTPTQAHARISQEGFEDRQLDFELEGIHAEIEPGKLGATLEQLAVGAVILRSLEIEGGMAEGTLSGEQKVQLVGLKLDADKLNKLLQKKLLQSDVDIDTTISGPPEAILIDTKIATSGGTVTIHGKVDASDAKTPRYDLSILASKIATEDLLQSETIPPITVERLRVGVRGGGRTKEDAEIDLGIHVAGVKAKGYVVDDVLGQVRYDGGELHLSPLRVQAYGYEIIAKGWVDLTRKLVNARLTMAGDVGKTLANLREGGVEIRTDLPRQAVVFYEDVITVDLTGQLEGHLDALASINDFRVFGGAIQGSAHAKLFRDVEAGPDDRKVRLEDLDAVLELSGISVNQALALRGKKLDGIAANVSGRVVVDDVPKAPWADYDLTIRAQGSDRGVVDPGSPLLAARARGRASKEHLKLNLDLDGRDGEDAEKLAQVEAAIPLLISDEHKGVAPWRPLHAEVTIPEKRFKDITYYLPQKLLVDPKTGKERDIPRGSIAAKIVVDGSAAAPTGTIDLDLQVKAHPLRRQRLKLDGTIASDSPKVTLATDLTAWLDLTKDETLKGSVKAELARSPIFPGEKKIDWQLDLDLLPQTLEDWVEAKVLGLEGVAKAGIHLKGTNTDLEGKVAVDVERFKYQGKGPVGLHVGAEVQPETTALDLRAAFDGRELLVVDGKIARPGRALLAALRDKTPGKSTADKLGNPAIDVKVRVPKHSPSTYAKLAPKIAKLPGAFEGSIDVAGNLAAPTATGTIGYVDFDSRSGKPGRAALRLDAGLEALKAFVELGPLPPGTGGAGDAPPIALAIEVPRDRIAPYSAAKKCYAKPEAEQSDCEPNKLPITAKVDAKNVPLADLVPAFAIENEKLEFAGLLDWDLAATIVLDPKPRFAGEGEDRRQLPPVGDESKLSGVLALHDGVIALLDSGRHYRGVQLALGYDLEKIRLERLELHESDREKSDRRLDARAVVGLDHLKPSKLDAHLSAKDWLVYGHEKVGPLDAPHASLDAEIQVAGDLSRPIKKIDVTIPKLALLAPDRFERAHQPELLSPTGDIVTLSDGQSPGKLVPKVAREAPEATPAKEEQTEEAEEKADEEPAEEPNPGEAVAKRAEGGLDLHVSIPNRAQVLLSPLNLIVVGDIDVKRRGEQRDIGGKLDVVGGDLSLGGKKHFLQKGVITFEPDCIACVDLEFAHEGKAVLLRQISKASGGEAVTIRLEGPITNRRTTLGGAASPGTLFDLLSAHNAGRPWHTGQPDMPATVTVEYPHYENLLLLSYLSVNAPHLLFMDKVGAWADVYDGRGTESYGQIRHYETEGYYADGRFRVRASAQPPQAGASENEISFDYLFQNTPQTAVGVGVSAGDRLGGGPGVFFEWSSED